MKKVWWRIRYYEFSKKDYICFSNYHCLNYILICLMVCFVSWKVPVLIFLTEWPTSLSCCFLILLMLLDQTVPRTCSKSWYLLKLMALSTKEVLCSLPVADYENYVPRYNWNVAHLINPKLFHGNHLSRKRCNICYQTTTLKDWLNSTDASNVSKSMKTQ